MILLVVVFVFVVLFWGIVEGAAVVGLYGAVAGERIERCQRCHRFGLTSCGRLHAAGCPTGLREHFAHACTSLTDAVHASVRVHLRHH